MEWKVNDTVICIKAYGRIIGKNAFNKDGYKSIELTNNKKYIILGITWTKPGGSFLRILNDVGVTRNYECRRFKHISDVRDDKLNNLLNG